MEGTGAAAVFSKVAIDQIMWCPLFITVFFTYLGLVNGDSFVIIRDKKRISYGLCALINVNVNRIRHLGMLHVQEDDEVIYQQLVSLLSFEQLNLHVIPKYLR